MYVYECVGIMNVTEFGRVCYECVGGEARWAQEGR